MKLPLSLPEEDMENLSGSSLNILKRKLRKQLARKGIQNNKEEKRNGSQTISVSLGQHRLSLFIQRTSKLGATNDFYFVFHIINIKFKCLEKIKRHKWESRKRIYKWTGQNK